MANHKSAEKRNRQRVARTARSRAIRTRVRGAVARARAALADLAADAAEAEGTADAAELVKLASRLLDRAAAKNAVAIKRASRVKSRLAIGLSR